MRDMIGRSISATGTGQLDAGTGYLLSASLCGGSDAATAVIRTGGASGTVIAKLGAAAGASVQRTFNSGVPYDNLHVTTTGTAPVVDVEVG